MGEIIDFSKYLKLKKCDDVEQKQSCEILSFDEPYIKYLYNQASIKLRKQDDFSALIDLNKAIQLSIKNNQSDIDTGLLGIFYFDSTNYDLASLYLFKEIATNPETPTPIYILLNGILYVKQRFNAYMQLNRLMFENCEMCLAQCADLSQNILKQMSKANVGSYNINLLKNIFRQQAQNKNLVRAKRILQTLWELDRSDPYINYWYLNYGETAPIEEIGNIPYLAVLEKISNILDALLNKDKLIKLCNERDVDCLVNFAMEYLGFETSVEFFKQLADLNNANINYQIENFLYSQGNDNKKLNLFMICIEKSLFGNRPYTFRYKDVIVKVEYFDYKGFSSGISELFAKGILMAIKELIILENTYINLNPIIFGMGFNLIISNNCKTEKEQINYFANIIMCNYYNNLGLKLDRKLEVFEKKYMQKRIN
ncbi:MAG: hypothetical protein ACI4TX_03655 [Christensenellales bacterium]